ncbi:MAG: (2Fe-2S)-binding protein [Phycisphaerae bacterium]|nr:(2Fe-2S)-binding protein [Phycisphaerae bacterium]
MNSFSFDGEGISFEPGDSVAAALIRSGKKSLRRTRFSGEERSIFCGIGQCFDCIVVVDGVANQRACLISATEGIKVEFQDGAG